MRLMGCVLCAVLSSVWTLRAPKTPENKGQLTGIEALEKQTLLGLASSPWFAEAERDELEQVISALFVNRRKVGMRPSLKWREIPAAVTLYTDTGAPPDSPVDSEPDTGHIVWASTDTFFQDVVRHVKIYESRPGWRPRAPLIIMSRGTARMDHTLSHLWNNYRIGNAVVVSNSTVRYQNMFQGKRIRLGFKRLALLPWYLYRRYFNLMGQKMKVSLFKNFLGYNNYRLKKELKGSGQDGEFLALLAEKMNFTAEVVGQEGFEDFGSYRPMERIFTGSLSQVLDGKTEMALNGRFIKNYMTSRVEFTSAVDGDQACILSRLGEKVNNWRIVVRSFGYSVLMAMGCAGVALWIVSVVISGVEGQWKWEAPTVLRALLASPLPDPVTASRRLLLMGCLPFAVVASPLLQAGLFLASHSPPYRPSSLYELRESKLRILYGTTALEGVFDSMNNRYLRHLAKNLRFYPGMPIITDLTSSAVLLSCRDLDYLVQVSHFPNTLIPIKIEQSYSVAYILPTGSVFYGPVNGHFLQPSVEAGLPQYWRDTLIRRMRLMKSSFKHSHDHPTTPTLRPINLSDLQFAFNVLIIGHISALIFFIVELAIFNYRKK